jgi:hypothetical protein
MENIGFAFKRLSVQIRYFPHWKDTQIGKGAGLLNQ